VVADSGKLLNPANVSSINGTENLMSRQIDLDLEPNHVGGGFEWDIEPDCTCGRVKEAVDEQFLFVANVSDEGTRFFYMLPVRADGTLFESDGVGISYCPWCGDKIKGHKKYPLKS
jgi:hypothetical protein